jgi:N utilization substance protein B
MRLRRQHERSWSRLNQTANGLQEPRGGGSLKILISRRPFLRHREHMGKRREARERAVQFLFQHDINPPEDLEAALDQFWDTQRAAAIAEDKGGATWNEPADRTPPTAEEAAVRLFADPLIRGALEHRQEADDLIKKHAINWEIHRIAAVDRNILRLAIFEMLHRDDIPPVVSINEAVDIAKKFSTQDSGKFVNGILDKVKGDLLRPARIVK